MILYIQYVSYPCSTTGGRFLSHTPRLRLYHPQVNNYANVDLICQIARSEQVDAVWPGWGHASENPRLPAKLKELNITFIGPCSPVMSVLGDKIAAGILAQTAGVPSIPWSGDGLTAQLTAEGTIPDETFRKACLNSVADAVRCAERIGYPVMLKASEGGGGKGIRMSNSKEELEQNFVQVQSEVPGSPIFMMQLCTGARHIEVQIMGDQHGQVVALNGRDCSTQRRFQKIFEEGPPVIVPKATFKEMERAAQRLTQSIGYVGAGTVEYLYNAKTNKFYFLELNPRLQVEHPVTEAITNVYCSGTEESTAMRVALSARKRLALTDRTSRIDFMKQDYVYPKVHCLAARITAENPDDGFKPTSGKIERIKFQSSVACWGYFSVWTHAAIHEFADSQFGHLFARGADREEARKTLVLALQNLEVVGEIRPFGWTWGDSTDGKRGRWREEPPTDYLVQLLQAEAFRVNSIDTSWLDGLIRERAVRLKYEQTDVVFYAAVLRAFRALQAKDAELVKSIEKRRLGLLHQVKGSCSMNLEITFEGLRYHFDVTRVAPDAFLFKISGGPVIAAQVREQPDGSLLVSIDGSVRKISGTEEALGLRLRLQGVGTVLLPTVFDASELRSDFNGKVMRYLVPEGAFRGGGLVKKDEAYVELEAMKMIMPLKARATGKLKQLKGPNSIVQAGELLGTLQLQDPSSVQQLIGFKGDFQLPASKASGLDSLGYTALKKALLALDGFECLGSAEDLAQEIFLQELGLSEEENTEQQLQAATQLLEYYLQVERRFGPLMAGGEDLAVSQVLQDSEPSGFTVQLGLLRAHSQLKLRSELLAGVMERLKSLPVHEPRPSDDKPRAVSEGLLNREVSQKTLRHIREEGHWKRLSELLSELSEMPSHGHYSPVARRAAFVRS
ncbi:unnamed protein product [Durusdinium trenchii]|uniref:biotin carboxylase n=1 Tax=Durusdinium trenchii TaxID=1381693 RepID=A0ABP0J2I1_9DINO